MLHLRLTMSRRRQQAGQHSIPHLRQTIDLYVVTSSVPTLNQASFIHFVATVERSGETFLSLIEGRVTSRPAVVSRPANIVFCFVGVRKNSFGLVLGLALALLLLFLCQYMNDTRVAFEIVTRAMFCTRYSTVLSNLRVMRMNTV